MASPRPSTSTARTWPLWAGPALVAAVAFLTVVVAIDPAGDYPSAPEGPGLTIDESFNVQQGVRLFVGLREWGLGKIAGRDIITLRDIFGDERDLPPNAPFGYLNPDHPPLGRLWLGVWHAVTVWVAPPAQHAANQPFVTASARVGSAAAFALTVLLCGLTAGGWYGKGAGTIAAISLALMPRVFGHAHLAALETSIGLMYFVAVVTVARLWDSDTPPTWRWAAIAGLALGGAMLTKIQGALVPIPVAIWALWHWRARAIGPLVLWGLVGLAVFFLLWPWLWFDPYHRFLEYAGRTAQRSVLYVWYFGQRYADREVPWHYPAVLFLTTVPLGLVALGVLGIFKGPHPPWKKRAGHLVLGAMLFPLVLFSLPRVSVYDGARLFLVVFPLWAIFIGRGGAIAYDKLREKLSPRVAVTVAACFLAGQAWGLVGTWPCFLSYYSMGLGGLRGAERLGMEIDYWGEGVTRDFLEQVVASVPEGAHIDVAPVLLPQYIQTDEMLAQSPLLRRRGIVLSAYEPEAKTHAEYVIVFRRLADLSPAVRELTAQRPPVIAVRRDGVLLAGLWKTGK
jgi:Dolichyl-phosphate-mannose-protein mannosyltransferase